MINVMLALLPAGSGRQVVTYLLLTMLDVLLRAVGAVLLIPLVAALFSGAPATAWPWVGWLFAVTLAGWIVDWAAARRAYRLGFSILDSGQRTLADRITAIDAQWFGAENTAVSRQAIAATGPDLVGIIIYFVTPLLGAIVLPLVIAFALFPVAWQLAVTALIGIVVLCAAFWVSGLLTRAADRAALQANARLTERVLEFARTQQALRAARRTDPARSHVGFALHHSYGATMRTLFLHVPGQLLFGLASNITLLALAGVTVVLVSTHSLSAAEAIALIVVAVRYLESFTVFAELSPGIETITATLQRIRAVLTAPLNPQGVSTVREPVPPRIELCDVSFSYHGDHTQRALHDFSLTFEPGTTTAIVGPSGSGKTTVLSLIAGLHRPDSGTVRVNGADLWSLDPVERRDLISVVFQHPYLFDGSVRDNIVLGEADTSEQALREVAALTRVDHLVQDLPEGWESRVGEAGGRLSGGERQRVSIARALLKPAPILLVDEATSALDTENETVVAASLTNDPIARTRVIVAHRLSSISAADRVIFLEDGHTVEDGTVAELLAAHGRFAEYWRQQHVAGGWRLGEPQSTL